MSEEMKMILALIRSLGKEIKASGPGISDNTAVSEAIYTRDKRGEYTYTVRDKP